MSLHTHLDLRTLIVRAGKTYIVTTVKLKDSICGMFEYETVVVAANGTGVAIGGEILDGELYRDLSEAIEGHQDIVSKFFPPVNK